MKIIKQGSIPQPTVQVYQGTCPKCGCIIEVNKTEVVVCEYGELPDKYNGWCPTIGCNHYPIYVNRQYRLPAASEPRHHCSTPPVTTEAAAGMLVMTTHVVATTTKI